MIVEKENMMNTALWVAQILLALGFFMAGMMKLFRPYEKITEMMAWAKDFSPGIVKTIGLLEVLGAIGVIAPAITGILPVLVPIAAAGLALTMIGAMITHIRIGEGSKIAPNIILLLIAVFVAVGRFAIVPIV
jgi:uncharacterized membrane protein YphA (DoxX/SURF4 family)